MHAINAGSTAAVTASGVTYQADAFFTGGALSATTDAIAATADDALYQSERYGNATYDIPLTNGVYSVVLHLVEMFHQSTGARTFNISVEGNAVFTNLDLYRLAGHDTAFEYTVKDVNVRDGRLTIVLTTVLENATISGIAIYSDAGGRLAP